MHGDHQHIEDVCNRSSSELVQLDKMAGSSSQFPHVGLVIPFPYTHFLGPPVVPFYPFWGRVPLLKQTTEKKGTLILTSLLEDLAFYRGFFIYF